MLVYRFQNGQWTQVTTLSQGGQHLLGMSVAVNGDGSVIVADGIMMGGNGPIGGFAYAFCGTDWTTSIPLTPADNGITYGLQCAISADASTIVITNGGWAYPEGGPEIPGWLSVFSEVGEAYKLAVTIPNPSASTYFGISATRLSHDGHTLLAQVTDQETAQAAYAFSLSGGTQPKPYPLPLPESVAGAVAGGLGCSGDAGTIVVGYGNAGACALTGSGWTQATTLATPVDVGGLDFGSALAVGGGGELLLVGSPGAGSLTGAGYVYGASGTAWKQLQEVSSPVSATLEQFADAVAISSNGDTALFGARGDSSGAGAAYVYSGYQWSVVHRLTASSPTSGDNYGEAVAVSADGSILAIGVPGANGNIGAVDVFSGTGWSQRIRLSASTGQAGDNLGASVAMSGDGTAILAGAPNGNGGSGSACVFSSSGWTQQTPLTPSGSPPDASFGAAVSLSHDGTVAAVGAPGAGNGAGAVYVCQGPSWARQSTIDVSGSSGDGIGAAVSLSGDASALLTGAPGTNQRAGAAYLATGNGFGDIGTLTAADSQTGDAFGDQVALNDNGVLAVIGAPGRSYSAGVVYVFSSTTATDKRESRPRALPGLSRGEGTLRRFAPRAPDDHDHAVTVGTGLAADGVNVTSAAAEQIGSLVGDNASE